MPGKPPHSCRMCTLTRRNTAFVPNARASKGGAPDDPLWLANIKANPDVEIEVAKDGGTEKIKARARVIASGPEYERLYAEQAKIWPGFRDYQKRTSRVIPVVVLEAS